MSLRKIAKELGVSPAYLSYMVSGKRPWRPDLYQRYQYFVNTSVNSQRGIVNTISNSPRRNLALVGVHVSRTHPPTHNAGATDLKSARATGPHPPPLPTDNRTPAPE